MLATERENLTGVKGVKYRPNCRVGRQYYACITIDYQQINLGHFPDPQSAGVVYAEAAERIKAKKLAQKIDRAAARAKSLSKKWREELKSDSQYIINKHRFHLKRYYGISREKYLDMLSEQAGECAICGKQTERLGVDHSHTTNEVRGLLCNGCNTRLGAFENADWKVKAEEYLSKYKRREGKN